MAFKVKGKEPRKWVWIMRDGTEIHVSKMEDGHLLNTIRFLRRWAQKLADYYNDLDRAPYWDSDDWTGGIWWDHEQFLEGVATWPTLLSEMERRDLTELPWKEAKATA